MTIERVTHGEEETESLGAALGRRLRPGDVVALIGELGAGKTRLIRGIAEGLGHDRSVVQSPTYVLVHEYAGEGETGAGPTTPLIHVDAYRLTGAEEVDSLGWEQVMSGEAVVAIEWAERVLDAIPAERIDVRIEHAGSEEDEAGGGESSVRRVRISAPAGWSDRLADLASL